MWPLTANDVRQAAQASTPRHDEKTPPDGRAYAHDKDHVQVLGAVIDSRKVFPGCLFVAIKGEKFDGHAFVDKAFAAGAVLALIDKTWAGLDGLSERDRARCVPCDDVTAAFRGVAAALRARFPKNFPVIGIGGSNGKTTTKEMLTALLAGHGAKITRTEKSENGFLGVAITLTQRSHAAEHPPAALVLEIGIDATGAMKEHVNLSRPDVVLLTALGPEHLCGLGTWENAAREECDLFFEGQPRTRVWQLADEKLLERVQRIAPTDVLVGTEAEINTARTLCGDEKSRQAFDACARLIWTLEREGAQEVALRIHWTPSVHTQSNAVFPYQGVDAFSEAFTVLLPGLHNARNFALAAATAISCGRDKSTLASGWKTFVAPERRSRLVELGNGILLYDDCYNASPASMDAAIDALFHDEWKDRPKTIVLGDMLDLGEESRKWHLALAVRLASLPPVRLCLYGKAMYDVYESLIENSLLQKNFVTVKWLPPEETPEVWAQEVLTAEPRAVVLVKGSNGMRLDRFVKALETAP